jgi:hypothetical protein
MTRFRDLLASDPGINLAGDEDSLYYVLEAPWAPKPFYVREAWGLDEPLEGTTAVFFLRERLL